MADLCRRLLGSGIREELSKVATVFSKDASMDVEGRVINGKIHIRIQWVVEEST
jgi:hypothetical protein